MLKKKLLFILFGLCLLHSCNKEEENLAPRDFGVGVDNVLTNSCLIRWSEATDPENSIVKYSVYIAEKGSSDFSLVADNISETQFKDKNREYYFFQSISNLEPDVSYEGKVIAYDQDGKEKVVRFFVKTLVDDFFPKVDELILLPFRYSVNVKLDLNVNANFQYEVKTDFYLNDELFLENQKPIIEFQDGVGDVMYHDFVIENLEEGTNYSIKAVIKGPNNNTVEEKSITTFTDVYRGSMSFKYQNEIDTFSINQFEKIIGDITIFLPERNCQPMNVNNECNYNISDLSRLNSIKTLEGNLEVIGPYDGLYGPGDAVPGLNNLNIITEELLLIGINPSQMLTNLNQINGSLTIKNSQRNTFTDLNFLSNLTSIGGNLDIKITYIENFCGLQQALSNGFSGEYSVLGNTYNPTLQQIIDGNCAQ